MQEPCEIPTGVPQEGPWCLACGYCLRGLSESSVVCPECGGRLSEIAGRMRQAQFRRSLWARRVLSLVTGILAMYAFAALAAPCVQVCRSRWFYVGQTNETHFGCSVTSELRQTCLGVAGLIPISRTSQARLMLGVAENELWAESNLVICFDGYTLDCSYVDEAGNAGTGKLTEQLITDWYRQHAPKMRPADVQKLAAGAFRGSLLQARRWKSAEVVDWKLPIGLSIAVGLMTCDRVYRISKRKLLRRVRLLKWPPAPQRG